MYGLRIGTRSRVADKKYIEHIFRKWILHNAGCRRKTRRVKNPRHRRNFVSPTDFNALHNIGRNDISSCVSGLRADFVSREIQCIVFELSSMTDRRTICVTNCTSRATNRKFGVRRDIVNSEDACAGNFVHAYSVHLYDARSCVGRNGGISGESIKDQR